ncbi:MAG: FAD binding domain-containing protein [Ktedonobacteraceae bacterium]|nr:FAD binding domain-containing protein [Ktedonobacteraceae bacterium]MBV9019382.1 FAD binding domain-containing protein [Ktedonobacteraceae bacterium]
MLLNLAEYHWVEHIDDALLLLARHDTKTVPLAGGTYLLGIEDDSIQAVVDLRELGLAYITENTQGIHIGAMTTLQSMAEHPLLRELAMGLLARAALASSPSRLIRASATIGGTLGAGVASQADLLMVLVAMDAYAVARSGSKTQVNLSGGTAERPGLALAGVTYTGKQERYLPCSSSMRERRPNELIIEVIVPRPAAGSGASFMRIGRTATDVALLNAAALVEVEDGVYQRVRVALGGVNMQPVRLHVVEKHLAGQPVLYLAESQRVQALLQAAMTEFRPPGDRLVSSGYRRASGVNLIYRTLEEATNTAYWRNTGSGEPATVHSSAEVETSSQNEGRK